jgi:peptidyl-prolyl cis-trans isomerase B (cyclophilin B)
VGSTKARRQRELATAKLVRQAERRAAARRRRRRIVAGTAAGVLALSGALVAVLLLVAGGDDDAPAAASCAYPSTGRDPSRPVPRPGADAGRNPATMVVETNRGTMTASLDARKAPCTVNALTTMARAKYFDGTPCHRQTGGPGAAISVLQCGDPTGGGKGGPGFSYRNENTAGDAFARGVIAMANSGPDTNGSQFFINYADAAASAAPSLAGKYSIVGKITDGLDVLDALTSSGVKGGGGDGPPASGARITSVKITQGG